MAKAKRSRGILRAAVCGVAVGTVGAFGLHLAKAPPQRAASIGDPRVTTLVTQEGGGNCRTATYRNDTPWLISANVAPCETIRNGRSGLPPVLAGYQATLRTR